MNTWLPSVTPCAAMSYPPARWWSEEIFKVGISASHHVHTISWYISFISCMLHPTCKAQSRTWCAYYSCTINTITAPHAPVLGDTVIHQLGP